VVGNSLPDDRSTDTMFVSCKVSIIDVASGTQDTIRLTRGSHSVYGLTVEPTGRYAFVTHLIGMFNLVASTPEKGHLHTNNLAMIDIQERKFINDVCLDLPITGLANPWGVKCTKDGEYMVIAHAGANELSLINLPRMIDTVLARSAKGEDLQREFTVLKECRKRLEVVTKGPRALAIAGTSVYTAGYFDDAGATMEEFLLDTTRSRPIGTYVIGEPQPWNGERNGENNFYDASLCFQKWQSCHSCHPFTRPCALNWILGGGAVVAPKNAKSMLYSWWTPPTMWTGRRGHAEKSIPAAVELEQFRIPADSLVLPLDTFIMYLKPTPSPYLIKGRLSEAALRGKALFSGEKAGCFNCHKAPLYCDLLFHNIGVPDPYDANTEWDTPSLIEAWRTGPYGHLGSFREIEAMVKLPGHNNASSTLSSEEMEDLLLYVLSL
ncbi:MAG: hypothetical protein JXA18_05020, partial [Chitinispirillaceae bacterium]|nr:hypothetical protein [Chitinispirillaceae bacterium]